MLKRLSTLLIIILIFCLPLLVQAQDVTNEQASLTYVIDALVPIAISVVSIIVIAVFAFLRSGNVNDQTFKQSGETLQDVLEIMDRLDIPGIDEHIAGAKKAIKDMTDKMGTSPEMLLLKQSQDKKTIISK